MNRTTSYRPMREAGVALVVVLVALIIISFAAVALLRSTDTGTLIVGNLNFKKTALAAGDAGSEAAIAWLNANGGTGLYTDQPSNGYYSTQATGCDLTGTETPTDPTDDVNWTGSSSSANCPMTPVAVAAAGIPAGYSVSYVINRMCNSSGSPNNQYASDGVSPMVCSQAAGSTSLNSTYTGPAYGNLPLTGTTQIFYRITTRIAGPRQTVRFTQAFVVF